MPTRGKGKNAGHNHVLAAIADAIHASTSYKGTGKGNKAGKSDGNKEWVQDGRNCTGCGDYNFGYRIVCRQCGARLPPPRTAANDTSGAKAYKGAGKGSGSTGAWNVGKGNAAENNANASPPAGPAAATAAAKPATADDNEQVDPAERVREIRSEEEKLRRTRGQYVDGNPRMLAAIDGELEKLAAEREKLQPLEVNLQAAAGRTAHARAALSKAKERRTLAASELRSQMEKYTLADKEVTEADAKLAAAEAAATAKRSEVKISGVHEAVELLRQTATEQCGDTAVGAQVAAALQQIANLLGSITTTAPATAASASTEKPPVATEANGKNAEGGAGGADSQGEPLRERHAVFAACGASEAKSRRVEGSPMQQNPAAHSPPPGGGGRDGDGDERELYAGGSVEGEVPMGGDNPEDGDLLAQAAAALNENADEL